MKPVRVLLIAGLMAALMGVTGCVVAEGPGAPVVVERTPAGELVVQEPPPALREEVVIGVAPSPLHVWVPGYWAWHDRWVWVAGRWEVPPRHGAVWSPGHWQSHAHGWVWRPGHWRG
jgi:hypothetical protein